MQVASGRRRPDRTTQRQSSHACLVAAMSEEAHQVPDRGAEHSPRPKGHTWLPAPPRARAVPQPPRYSKGQSGTWTETSSLSSMSSKSPASRPAHTRRSKTDRGTQSISVGRLAPCQDYTDQGQSAAYEEVTARNSRALGSRQIRWSATRRQAAV